MQVCSHLLGFAFIHQETNEYFEWVLRHFRVATRHIKPGVFVVDCDDGCIAAIAKIYPYSGINICIWHVNKNVLAKCREFFVDFDIWEEFIKTWNQVVYSNTEQDFRERWETMKLTYYANQRHQAAINYIEGQWIPRCRNIISCYVDKVPHLGCRASSRAEGNHNHIKNGENLIRCNLFETFNVIERMLENQFIELNSCILSDMLRLAFDFHIEAFRELHFRVSHFALKLVHIVD